jgi:nucleotide-binding universal stress UspA family protein/mono/diheme cytochrome c family protein
VNRFKKDRIMAPDIKRILVPLDFTVNSNRALDYAHGLARKFEASLHLVHVCEVPSMMTGSLDAYVVVYSDWSRRLGEDAEAQLVREKTALADVKVTTEVLFGPPAFSIIDAAQANESDLIVMGTHGHGAVMHMVMGSVAERVVRGAPCPVLTVREPREREVAKGAAKKLAVAGALAIASLVWTPAMASAQEVKQTTAGAAVFRTYCASCHGTEARGDGPLASAMRRKPVNLTEIAKQNGWQFPSEMVFTIIDGRQPLRGHGGPDMPVWGDVFSRTQEAGDAERVKAVIKSLVDYLDGIQLRPAHEQQR